MRGRAPAREAAWERAALERRELMRSILVSSLPPQPGLAVVPSSPPPDALA